MNINRIVEAIAELQSALGEDGIELDHVCLKTTVQGEALFDELLKNHHVQTPFLTKAHTDLFHAQRAKGITEVWGVKVCWPVPGSHRLGGGG